MQLVKSSYCNFRDQDEGTNPEALGPTFYHQGPAYTNLYGQAVTNMVDRNRGGDNDLPRPSRSEKITSHIWLV